MAADHSNSVIVTGQSGYDCTTIKYSGAGVPLWTKTYSGGLAPALAVDHAGNVIVTGTSVHGHTNYDFGTVKHVSVPSPVLTALQLANGTFQLRVDSVLQPGTLVIEASTNLSGWAPVFTNNTPANVVFYTHPDGGSAPTRFYRAFQFP